MAKLYIGNNSHKIYLGNEKIKKEYIGTERVYSSGNICVYYVNTSNTYQEEIDDGVSVLSPKSFTPVLSGWTFVGWRTDKIASGSVLSSLTMGDNPITLYAVFKQAVTLTKIINKSTTTTTGYRYYNNGNVANATFSISKPSLSGATFLGWSTSTSASVAYGPNTTNITLSSNATIRSIFKYNDVTQNVAAAYSAGDWVGPGTTITNGTQLSIDCSKYSGIKSTNCKARMKVNWDTRAVGWQAACGGNSVTLMSWWHSDYNDLGADSGIKDTPYTINFSQTSGTTSLVFSHIKNPHVDNYSSTGESNVYAHTVTLTGRTTVG